MVAVFLIVLHCRKMNDAFVSTSRKYIYIYCTIRLFKKNRFVISLFPNFINCDTIWMDNISVGYISFEVYQLNGEE